MRGLAAEHLLDCDHSNSTTGRSEICSLVWLLVNRAGLALASSPFIRFCSPMWRGARVGGPRIRGDVAEARCS